MRQKFSVAVSVAIYYALLTESASSVATRFGASPETVVRYASDSIQMLRIHESVQASDVLRDFFAVSLRSQKSIFASDSRVKPLLLSLISPFLASAEHETSPVKESVGAVVGVRVSDRTLRAFESRLDEVRALHPKLQTKADVLRYLIEHFSRYGLPDEPLSVHNHDHLQQLKDIQAEIASVFKRYTQ